MSREGTLLSYVCRLGDNALILGQRMVELVAAMPDLEEELANANFALDYFGQARMFYSYAGELEGQGRSEDDFALLREENEYRSLLLLEQPNGHFGDVIVKLVLFDLFYLAQLEVLTSCRDERVAAIAARAEKEIRYHLRHTSHWLLRLGDGTEQSHSKVQASVDALWQYTGEMFAADFVDTEFEREFGGPELSDIEARWRVAIAKLLAESTLRQPQDGWMIGGGKAGRHSEHLGFMIAEMQYLQRTHPGATW